ncbi:hypothetical protein EJ06DRAFT_60588 [Trichodelitschia bisporula]|uniref:BZIP domain-containing protein n=1 Tax=Trichodelitschia bisporula TaxID=703511 RepID=A0A6G1HU93_9PEZI|nr:hypothetical protein EJ06DRAFT_60588 [Trichodelitschia bisporula]
MAGTVSASKVSPPRPEGGRLASPKDTKKNGAKSEDTVKDAARHTSPSKDVPQPVQAPETTLEDAKAATNGAGQPLGPPPRPSQGNGSEAPDYFNQVHTAHPYQSEPNPFEAQFGTQSSETPGKVILPPPSSLTSPNIFPPGSTPTWPSLRTGPLSPAMLQGPTGTNDYFGDTSTFGRGFPTPNESSLRTGLTPGGGGSMFPAPSPNSQALFNSIAGGVTPGAADFFRTNLAARAATATVPTAFNAPTSQPAADADPPPATERPTQMQQQEASRPEHYLNGDADAVNGLYMLAQANPDVNRAARFTAPLQPSLLRTNNIPAGAQSVDTSPLGKGSKGSIGGGSLTGGSMTGDMDDMSDDSDEEQVKPTPKGRGKQPPAPAAKAGNKRKNEEKPTKGGNKRGKNNNAQAQAQMQEDMDDGEGSRLGADGKKMTDEEKRKNFLERNRVAALKCRQRKKQWLANLQQKVELFTQENEALGHTVTSLREEIVNLKTLLMAHKDCPISMQQNVNNPQLGMYLAEMPAQAQHMNPYGMAAIGMQQQQAGHGGR